MRWQALGLGALAALLLTVGSKSTQAQDVESEIERELGGSAEVPSPPEKAPKAKKKVPPKEAPAPAAAAPAAEETPPAPAPAAELPQIGEDQLAVFVLQRGFYFSGDLGVFLAFGGTKGHSLLEPYVAVKAGFDINDYLGVQVALSTGYSAGNPISAADRVNAVGSAGGTEVENFSLFNFGAELVGALRPTGRFAIEPRAGGGMTVLAPQPHRLNDPTTPLPAMNPHLSFGLDFKYLTLLTDFTAGMSLSGFYVMGPNMLGAAAAFSVRYTF